MKRFSLLLILTVALFSGNVMSQSITNATFLNPLLPSGADPFSFYKDDYYYYTHTLGNRIDIWKTKSLADLPHAERKTIFTPPAGTAYSKNLWAPEIQHIHGKWYVYFAADDGKNENHRLYVLENAALDPFQGQWVFKGKIADTSDKWAIDGDVFEYKKRLYMIWSGWEGTVNGQQNIYIAKMKNPWTIEGDRVLISMPTFEWEKDGDLGSGSNPSHVNVNEGPQAMMHNKKLFIVFSASGCWTDNYALGLLTFTGRGNILDASKWVKNGQPLFKQNKENGVFAPGHNSFFKSPDQKEDWILYHANDKPGQGCGRFRSPRAQRFSWNKDGTPNLGEPVKTATSLDAPSENKQLTTR
ncbi:glycoside hydrolase family 43 protein [Chitinophagaceae bacterium LB-8]|uniref:Glycoside hydrolase family 43 protein n=1 Tax=Paraflavisolibacter caeni TaxID=2982496 RepID=A0A9X3BHG8_9BACT|nr:glycoside hydrolase family 43 protein [Paraflavisolibacter caeni]MCU7549592.1 glycoside hydrolase family 43 protein [Paraflavisolibacter caeni]